MRQHRHAPASTRSHHRTHRTPIVRLALACALSVPIALGAAGAVGRVAFADTVTDAGTPTDARVPSQDTTAGKTMRIVQRMTVTSREQALGIALADLGIAEADVDKVDEIDYEDDMRPWHWEVEFVVGNVEYEYEISPFTGAILSVTREYEKPGPRMIIRHHG